MDKSNPTPQPPEIQSNMPSPVSKSNNTKLLIFILAGVAIVLAVGAYALGSKQSQPVVQNTVQATPISSPTPKSSTTSVLIDFSIPLIDPSITAKWKMYESEGKIFSFKYPPEWIYETKKTTLDFKEKKYNAISIVAGIPLTIDQLKTQQEYWGRKDVAKMYENFSLLYATSADFKNLFKSDLLQDYLEVGRVGGNLDFLQTLWIESINTDAVLISYSCQEGCTDILFAKNNTIFNVNITSAGASESTLRQILSTFRFSTP